MGDKEIKILDSTLRDGAQGEGISFSVQDKLKIVKVLDEMKIDFIEAGNPGSNPKDMEFFRQLKKEKINYSKIAAFGSTRRPNIKVWDDNNIKNLLLADTEVVVIFGKSWDFQVKDILKTTLEENIEMIKDTITYLVQKDKEVIFDAEHFFDGYKENKEYALKTLKAAKECGARSIVLCDTNGGTLPMEVKNMVEDTVKIIGKEISLGIHCHNDIGMADANSIMAVTAGVSHVQGTFIGIGERCGNANLSTIMPTLKLKLGYKSISDENLSRLTSTARFISEISNIPLRDDVPYVGSSAFSHKGGMHIDAVCKSSKAYEHINPQIVGNKRRFLISEVSGKSTVFSEIHKIFPNISKDDEAVKNITNKLKEMEYEGYQFEGADGTVELIMRKLIGKYKPFFTLNHFKVFSQESLILGSFSSSVMINIQVDGKEEISAAEGTGPVNALDKALRKALEVFYPKLKEMRLVDYKVRVLDSENATKSKVRVLIESTDGVENWSTVGVSRDIIEASWKALVDSIEYKLLRDIEKKAKAYF